MKAILILILTLNFTFANYSIFFTGIKLGESKTLDTIQNNYLEATVTNSLVKLLLGKDKFIFFDDNFKLKKDTKNIKYKKDTHAIIEVLKRAQNNTLKSGRIYITKEKYIDIKVVDNNYKFIYTAKKEIGSQGYFELKDKKLIKFIDSKNNIKILKN